MSNPTRDGDPFDDLYTPPVPAAPDRAFVARLRRRLVDALAVAADGTMLPTVDLDQPSTTAAIGADRSHDETNAAMTDTTITRTSPAITPYLAVAGAAAAIDWYIDIFGAVETVYRLL